MTRAQCAVILGGHGGVGSMIGACLQAHSVDVLVVDRVPPADAGRRWVRDDVEAPGPTTLEAVAVADLVVLTLPEPVALRAVRRLAERMRPGTLLVDTLSVKSALFDAIVNLRPRCEVLGINPLFAPSLGLQGQTVVGVTLVDGPRVRWFLRLLESAGANVVALHPREHDRMLVPQQALAHATVLAFGAALRAVAADASQVGPGPPPYRVLLALLGRILGGVEHAYWDIQASNSHAAAARSALAGATRRIADLIDVGREEDFYAFLAALRTAYGSALGPLQATAERVVRAASEPGSRSKRDD